MYSTPSNTTPGSMGIDGVLRSDIHLEARWVSNWYLGSFVLDPSATAAVPRLSLFLESEVDLWAMPPCLSRKRGMSCFSMDLSESDVASNVGFESFGRGGDMYHTCLSANSEFDIVGRTRARFGHDMGK